MKGTSLQSSETQPEEICRRMSINTYDFVCTSFTVNEISNLHVAPPMLVMWKRFSISGSEVLTTISFPAFSGLLATVMAAAAAAPEEIPTCTIFT
jgi:hypothetical protein